jgi:hypothetical protein
MSAQFHLAQRGGVIISGDYSGEYLPPSGKYGITSNGYVWLNTSPVQAWGYEDGWSKPVNADENFVKALKENNVGYRTSFSDAVASARSRSRAPASGGSPALIPGVNPPPPGVPFYQQNWFLPVVGVSAVVVVLGVVLWPSSAKSPAAV